jgi:hypothetical protein
MLALIKKRALFFRTSRYGVTSLAKWTSHGIALAVVIAHYSIAMIHAVGFHRYKPNFWYEITLTAPQCYIRCQTAPSLWTLGRDQPVIPGVAFIR